MIYVRKKTIFVIILFLSIVVFINESFALSINPGRVYKKVKPGQKISGEYKICNNEKSTVKITIRKTTKADWFLLKTKELIIKSGESKSFLYEIYVKDKNKKGELKTEIAITQKILKEKDKNTSEGSGASFQTRIKLPVYIMIESTELIDYGLIGLNFNGSFSKKKKSINGKVTVSLDVKNKGNVHFLCESRLTIFKLTKDNQKDLIGEQKPYHPVMIFPDKKKNIKLEYSGNWEPGRYIARLFCYFKFDDDLDIRNVKTLKKERCFNTTKLFMIDKNGEFKLAE